MRRLITLIVVGLLLLVGGYLAAFKRHQVMRTYHGYSAAKTPQAAADNFCKALGKRDYYYAAEYCTRDFAEQLQRGDDAAQEFATKMDNMIFQMKERDLIRDESKFHLYCLDPFPKDISITVGKENGDSAEAVIVFGTPIFRGDNSGNTSWRLKPEIFNIFIRSLKYSNPTTVSVPMRKVDGLWKLDFPVDPTLQARVAYMNDKYKNYVNPFEIIGQEVKNDPSTKENATSRLRNLLEEAAKE